MVADFLFQLVMVEYYECDEKDFCARRQQQYQQALKAHKVRARRAVNIAFGVHLAEKNYENRQQIGPNRPTRVPILWIRKSHDVRKCLFVINIAFGVHLAEKFLKIFNICSESANPIADLDRIRLGSCCPKLTFIGVPKRSLSEN